LKRLAADRLDALAADVAARALLRLQAATRADRVLRDVASDVTPDNEIVDGSGSSDLEEPMYRWISSKPYPHHDRWRVWFKTLDGERSYQTFETLADAHSFVSTGARRTLRGGGHPVADLLERYLESRADLKASSIRTLRFRLGALFQQRRAMPVEAFPWAKAWKQYVSVQSVDSQHGVVGALRGFLSYCRAAGLLKKAPDLPSIRGRKRRGKAQLRIDEARKLVAEALRAGDPLALAAATMVLTGLRPGEVMALKVRDCDDGGAVLWVESGKTAAARRAVEVAAELRPFLVGVTAARPAFDPLFEHQPRRKRAAQDQLKSRTDALLRRLRTLCAEAKVPAVVPHSLRGLHATLASGFGATSHAVAAALGHTSFVVTARHYVDRNTLEQARSRRSREVLRGNCHPESVTAAAKTA
jgi:integrase